MTVSFLWWVMSTQLIVVGAYFVGDVHRANNNKNNKERPLAVPSQPQRITTSPFTEIVENATTTTATTTTGQTLLFKPPTAMIPTKVRRYSSEHQRNVTSTTSTSSTNTTAKRGAAGPWNTPPTGRPSSRNNGWIGTDQLNHIKETVNLVDVVDAYNLPQFQRKGAQNRATAVCPFHDDRNPSLHVDGQRGIYKCFACGEGGDVFRFVSQMARVEGQGDLSFWEAVRRVQNEFGDGQMPNPMLSYRSNHNQRAPATLSEEEREQQDRLRDRIYQMNAAAAAFYSETLTLPRAGGARLYLSTRRHVPPTTTRAFALGFAPDVYFGPKVVASGRGTDKTATPWGDGSLVQHLSQLGFTPDELLEAGLVVQTKRRAAEKQSIESTSSSSATDSSEEKSNLEEKASNDSASKLLSYDGLIDRFRGRIVVPIFDATGKRILGFGGRILDESQQSGDYEQPKYLNSPESLVFQKKNVLFGLHLANEAPRESVNDITLVEGYMDAIALHSVGISGVVASMGTAISSEQLVAAANAAYRREGSLILCLDSDDAGVVAVERLCVNGLITSVLEKCNIDIKVACIPNGLKDPGEFVESKLRKGSKKETVASDFAGCVISQAVPWFDWYTQRILEKYASTAETGEEGSLQHVMDLLADFMDTCRLYIEPEAKASRIALSLADLTAESMNSTTMSDTVRNQFETDLLHLAATKGLAKEAAKRGGAEYDLEAEMGPRTNRLKSAMARGYGPTSSNEGEKISQVKLSKSMQDETDLPATRRATTFVPSDKTDDDSVKQGRSSFKVRQRRSPPTKPDLTPHYNGIAFAHEADAAWLGANERGTNLILGAPEKNGRFVPEDEQYPHSTKRVYFNSNEFHGEQAITDEAIKAGYSSEGIVKDPSIAYKGVGVLMKPNMHKLHASTEDELLKLLIRSVSARLSVRNWMDSRRAVHSEIGLHWTSSAKEWLFSSLLNSTEDLPTEQSELKLHLSNREDVPTGAFCRESAPGELTVPNKAQESLGFFDNLFSISEIEGTPTISHDGDLQAQELLSTLVWSSTANHAQKIKKELHELTHSLSMLPQGNATKDQGVDAANETLDEASIVLNSTMVAQSQLESKCTQLAQNLLEVNRKLQSLGESASRIRNRVVQTSKAGLGSQQQAVEVAGKDFEERLDEFLVDFVPPSSSGSSEMDLLMGPHDPDDNVPFEDECERIDEEYNDVFKEDGSLNDPSIQPPILNKHDMDDDDEEPMEDFDARFTEEWKGWLD